MSRDLPPALDELREPAACGRSVRCRPGCPGRASGSPCPACSSQLQYHPSAPKRTVVYGMSRDRRPVRVTIAGVTRTVAAGGLGTFIDVCEGVADMEGASATTTVGGQTTRRSLGCAP